MRVHGAERLASQGLHDRRRSRRQHLGQNKSSRRRVYRGASWPCPSAVVSRRTSQLIGVFTGRTIDEIRVHRAEHLTLQGLPRSTTVKTIAPRAKRMSLASTAARTREAGRTSRPPLVSAGRPSSRSRAHAEGFSYNPARRGEGVTQATIFFATRTNDRRDVMFLSPIADDPLNS